MDVSNVVDHETKSKGELVFLIAEVASNLVDIVALALSNFALKEASQVSKSLDYIVVWLDKVIIIERTTFIKVWNVDEVPIRLERISHPFDVVCEVCTLSEGMVSLLGSDGCIILLQRLEDFKSSVQGVWIFVFKDCLGLSGNYRVEKSNLESILSHF